MLALLFQPSMTSEQQARIERNKQLAMQKRAARLGVPVTALGKRHPTFLFAARFRTSVLAAMLNIPRFQLCFLAVHLCNWYCLVTKDCSRFCFLVTCPLSFIHSSYIMNIPQMYNIFVKIYIKQLH